MFYDIEKPYCNKSGFTGDIIIKNCKYLCYGNSLILCHLPIKKSSNNINREKKLNFVT